MSAQSEHEKWMARAIQLAKQAETLGEVPIGAVIVKEGEVLGEGYNRREIDRNPLAHAELMAIQQACERLGGWRLAGCDLYVTLEPCPMCAGAIVQARLRRVIYGTEDPKAGYAGSLHNTLQDERLNHQTDVIAGIRREECQHLLKDFFRRLREQKKAAKGMST
ncbi:CMP/dCMP deaminase zinc-binding [Caldalkalibacillus thermarum TA2.A1]|uniref:tRNA-specific adenosine deaminase n=1 Tax=Caldalkalibacillus thermarum (strain TA2.A1) TaxID=986075 RepID=F5L9W0_CALTT|nr:tRNA adenosine(34) deaminase TadA [Caldalkalibacillus thermarum]EGL81830.1 CMP/dCMP deaminase zinc-binding [Caldalkalibacillus thermarum TA2.A1]QZT34320.1 tRNA adenosine(34) deaminase TadA [Caldalkalibacillus thermarum TA2.A1]